MPTASLHRYLVAAGVGIVALSGVALDVVLYLSWRPQLTDASVRRLVAIEAVATVASAGVAGVLLHRWPR